MARRNRRLGPALNPTSSYIKPLPNQNTIVRTTPPHPPPHPTPPAHLFFPSSSTSTATTSDATPRPLRSTNPDGISGDEIGHALPLSASSSSSNSSNRRRRRFFSRLLRSTPALLLLLLLFTSCLSVGLTRNASSDAFPPLENPTAAFR